MRLENAMAPTRKLPKDWKPEPKKSTHHTPALANKHTASTQAPTRKVAPSALPKSPGGARARIKGELKPGEKMVFGRIVKTGG
jgi:hypothetical protein